MTKSQKQTPSVKSSPALEEQIADLTARYARALADYQNLEKRTSTQLANRLIHEKTHIFTSILSLLDDLERAQSHIKDPGLDLVITHFHTFLASQAIQPINTKNQPFDPATMECIDKAPGPKNQVVTTHTKGYKMGAITLRPATVTVGA